MKQWLSRSLTFLCRKNARGVAVLAFTLLTSLAALAEPAGEAALKLPDLSSVSFFHGAINGHKLLLIGILFLGIFPSVVLNVTNESVNLLARVFGGG